MIKQTLVLVLMGIMSSIQAAPQQTHGQLQSSKASEKKARAEKASILYQTRAGNVARAVNQYRLYKTRLGQEDYELVEQMAAIMIEQGSRSSAPEDQLLSIYGAGISRNPQLLHVLEQGLDSPQPIIQLAALHFLQELHDDRADHILKKAMASPYLAIRLEAAIWLAQNRNPQAAGQIEALYEKVDPVLRPIFPQLFAMLGDSRSITLLKQMMANQDPLVRVEAIVSAAKYQCDELLPQIRSICNHPGIDEREASASALGEFKDEQSAKMLEKLSQSSNENVKLAALNALHKLGRTGAGKQIEKMAVKGNLFAIKLLGEIPGSENLLYQLAQVRDLQIRLNALLALLERRDPRCAPQLKEILLNDPRDLLLLEYPSPGQSLTCWKIITSAKQTFGEKSEQAAELSLKIRQAILVQAFDLPLKDFLQVASEVFQSKQVELIPIVIELVQSADHRESIAFLKQQLNRVGAPLVRHYCNLALYKLGEPGPYTANLYTWISKERHSQLIDFEPLKPLEGLNKYHASYSLTPSETSALLIESLAALAEQKDPGAIDALLHVIAQGNPKNRYALAGLLMRAIE